LTRGGDPHHLGIIDDVHAAGGQYYPASAWDGPQPLGPAKFHRIEKREPTPTFPIRAPLRASVAPHACGHTAYNLATRDASV
jgi:hypothetical protein